MLYIRFSEARKRGTYNAFLFGSKIAEVIIAPLTITPTEGRKLSKEERKSLRGFALHHPDAPTNPAH